MCRRPACVLQLLQVVPGCPVGVRNPVALASWRRFLDAGALAVAQIQPGGPAGEDPIGVSVSLLPLSAKGAQATWLVDTVQVSVSLNQGGGLMYLSDLRVVLLRRWYLMLPGLTATAAPCLLAANNFPATLQARANVVILAAEEHRG